MTGITFLTLLAGFLSEGWVPPEHPLSEWILHGATAGGPLRPSVFPGSVATESGSMLPSGLLAKLEALSRPGGSTRIPGLGLFGASLLTAAELEDSSCTETRAGMSIDAFLEPAGGFHIRERLSVWASSDEDIPSGFTPVHEGVEQGRHLYVDWGYAAWNRGGFEAAFGRIPQVWGPGRYTSLLLSNNSPPLDMIRFRWQPAPWFAFTGLTSSVESDSASYLTAHRLDIIPSDWLALGFSEAIFFVSDGLDLAYMNPLIPWYPVQWNERDDDNAMLCLDATVRPLRGLAAYGELLIDDLQYQTEWGRPSRLGWTAGIEGYAGSTAITCEYTRIDRFVYSQKLSQNFYLHHGEIIGSGLGPDCDRAVLGISTAALWPCTVGLRADHTRHGEGTVCEGFPDSLLSDESFPSGTVEHSTGAVFDASLYAGGWLEAHASVGRRWFRNLAHESGAEAAGTEARIELVARFDF